MTKLKISLLITLFLIFFTKLLIKVFYIIVFNSESYITFAYPYITFGKNAIISVVIIALLLWSGMLVINKLGVVLFSIAGGLLTLSIFVTLFWINATNDQIIVKQRMWGKNVHNWEEVTHISTKANLKWGATREGKYWERETLEYRIHFTDGTSINTWDDITSLEKLDAFVKEKGIPIEYGAVTNPSIRNDLEKYIDGNGDTARKILNMY